MRTFARVRQSPDLASEKKYSNPCTFKSIWVLSLLPRSHSLTPGSMPMVLRNFCPILEDFFPMLCMFNLEIFLVRVLSSSFLYLSTVKRKHPYSDKIDSIHSKLVQSTCTYIFPPLGFVDKCRDFGHDLGSFQQILPVIVVMLSALEMR